MNTSARIRAWGRALFVVTVLVGHVIALSDGCRLPEGWGLGGACEWSSVRRDLSLCPDLAGAAAGSEQVRAAGDLQGGSRVGAAPPRPHAHGDGGASARGRPCSDRSARTVDSHVHQRARVYNLRLAGGRQKLTVVSGHGRADAGVDEVPVSSIRLAQRAIVLGCWFLLPLITSPIAVLVKPFREVVWYRLLAMSLGRSGAAFIKWAQWASVRPDMFPQALCDVLSKLTHAAPMHSWDYSQRLLCHAVGGALHTYFDSIDTSAFASGSIAQVYKGYVKGRKVAVKVRHPGVDEQIALDFRIMLAVGQFIDSLPGMGWVNMRASMQQFSHTIASQTRLDIEGNHLDIFNANFRHDRRWCGFPEALLKTESVLVESYQEGFCATSLVLPHSAHAHGIKDHTKEAEPGGRSGGVLAGLWGWVGGLFGGCFGWGGGAEEERIEVEESTGLFIVSKGVDTYLKMLLKDNLMHADLHPGNILLQPGQAERGRRPRIVLVDAGMVAQLSASEQDNFIGKHTHSQKSN